MVQKMHTVPDEFFTTFDSPGNLSARTVLSQSNDRRKCAEYPVMEVTNGTPPTAVWLLMLNEPVNQIWPKGTSSSIIR
jgi:hypothetical protein